MPVIDTFYSLENEEAVKNTAFVPPKSERVKWVNHFTGVDVATGEEVIDETIRFAEKQGWDQELPNTDCEIGDLAVKDTGGVNSSSPLR